MKKKLPIVLLTASCALLPLAARPVWADDNLLSGYTRVEKVYAMVDAPSFLNVRERADKKSRIVGILHPGDFCYILYGAGKERVYIESNELRGFVDGKWLRTGDEITSFAKITTVNGTVPEGIVIVAPENNKAVSYTLTTTQDVSGESPAEGSSEAAAAPAEESAEGAKASAEENAVPAGSAAAVSSVAVGSSDNYAYELKAVAVKNLSEAALSGDLAAQEEIIQFIATAADAEWNRYGYLKSVVIAQVVEETEWLSFPAYGGILPSDNNVLGIPVDFLTGLWASNWSGTSAIRNIYGEETEIRVYESVNACLMDYAAFMVGVHPELARELDAEKVLVTALGSNGEPTEYTERLKMLIGLYDLTRFDPAPLPEEPEEPENPAARIDESGYGAGELELIWALVAQEDDTSYEGALAVISSVMNRADMNYGGHGTGALDQLTAPGQFCYSPEISPSSVWEWRLGGNVAEFVKAAVNDCLNGGIRNHGYINFRSYDGGGWVRIGTNYYF